MTEVIDSSVVLAAVPGDRGGEVLDEPGQLCHLSMVNLAEVYTKTVENGGAIADVIVFLESPPTRIRAFLENQAEEIGRLRPLTRHHGLSLRDRACPTLAGQTDLPVLTADTQWIGLDLGIDIRLIR